MSEARGLIGTRMLPESLISLARLACRMDYRACYERIMDGRDGCRDGSQRRTRTVSRVSHDRLHGARCSMASSRAFTLPRM